MPKIVSDEYPWSKLLIEYLMYCAVGCINVVVFAAIYIWLYDMVLIEQYRAASAWAVAYFISSCQAHFLHRWLTFESPTGYSKSLYVTLLIYAVLWAISTTSIAYFSDTLGYNHAYTWAANTAAFGFLAFLALRIFAFPLSDGRVTRKERLDNFRERRKA